MCRSTQIKTYSWDNAQVVLAGNKCDMEEERVVSVDSGRLLAEQLGKCWSNINVLLFGHYLNQPCLFMFSCYLLSPSWRFWVLWDQRQGQHQREADLRTSRWPNLRQDVRELGHWSGRHHRSSHCQTHRQRSTPPAAWMQLLVTDVRKQREGSAGPVMW